MKLLMAEKEDQIWYFTSIGKAAAYINTSSTYIKMVLAGISKKVKGWTFEWTEDENIINKFINPEP